MSYIGRKGIHYFQKLNAANVASGLLEKGQNRVVDASLTLIRERAKLKVYICIYIYICSVGSLCNFIFVFVFGFKFVEFVKNEKQGELVRAVGGAVASASLLGVPLGHNSSFLQGPAFAPPRIREAIWCGSTNSATEEGLPFNQFVMLL